ncbi:MAG: preprotein translocase subunit YajC [Akkermansiaceae bacterium]|nr:preprotein translocase subunit YajC [Akkermansiaceae bacterium]NNM30839.1 preprotein translocase subunit YajC [Akkermansiaceae bacterium]
MNFITFLAQEPAPEGPSGLEAFLGGPFLMIGALFLMMYFLLIRPQQRQRKEQEARIAALEKGDQVVTAGGIHATVHHISEKTVTLKLSEGIFVPFEKSAVTSVSKRSKGDGKAGPAAKDPATK